MTATTTHADQERADVVRRLHAERPRSALLRWSLAVFTGLVVATWLSGDFAPGNLFTERRARNLERFLGEEIRPWPLRDQPWDWGVAWDWAAELMADGGTEAVWITLAMSFAAIALAGLGGILLSLPAARTFASPAPFLDDPVAASRAWPRRTWLAVLIGTRGLLIGLRAVPEYVWTFLLIGIFGISPWPAVVALAIHNTGILGKLGAETVENLPPRPQAALRGAGATRLQVASNAVFPASLGRFLLYFFYRWETCVREATVLGMLGIVSLGYLVLEARVRDRYDEMLFFVLLGAGLVLLGDAVSALARHLVRRSG